MSVEPNAFRIDLHLDGMMLGLGTQCTEINPFIGIDKDEMEENNFLDDCSLYSPAGPNACSRKCMAHETKGHV